MKAEHAKALLHAFLRHGFSSVGNVARSAHGGMCFSEMDLVASSLPVLIENLISHRAKIHYTFQIGDEAMRQAYEDADAAVNAALEALKGILDDSDDSPSR